LWAYLLQRRRIQPGKPVVVSNIQMAKLGINRFVKMRAERCVVWNVLASYGYFERAGKIHGLKC